MAEEKEQDGQKRALWSGNVTFGLVSIPVNLLSANRPRPISLRMLAPDGTPLRRRYFCPREERMLTADEIVRGYEFDTGQFVVVSDEELAALAPEKSREIDLRRFVPLEQVDRRYFNRGYLLTPAGDTKKAYLLLAEAMERNQRAGIATFILHGKEHLVAIMAENGILHAEILHFSDELRTPEQLDLQVPDMADATAVEDLAARILAVRHDGFQKEALKDPQSRQLLALVEQKKADGKRCDRHFG
jgi:DNA end-binding protein Ku